MSLLLRVVKTVCIRCQSKKIGVTRNELVFDTTCVPELIFSEYCVKCLTYIYAVILSRDMQDQRQDCFSNQENYFGVLSLYNRLNVKSLAGLGEIFFWELVSASSSYRGLVHAVTILSDSQHRMGFWYESHQFIDTCTTYIFRQNGIYCITYGATQFYADNSHNDDVKPIVYCLSLDDALAYVQLTHIAQKHKIPGRDTVACVCTCRKANRFAYVHKDSGKLVREPWTLQQLTAFYMKQFGVFSKKALFNMRPWVVRDMIIDSDACDIFHAKSGHKETRQKPYSRLFSDILP